MQVIKTIANLGVNSDQSQEIISKIHFSNFAASYLVIACAIFAPFYYVLGFTELSLFLVPVIIGYSAVVLLNYAGLSAFADSVLLLDFIFGTFY